MAPPPAEDANSSLLSATTVKRRGRPPKIPTTPTIDLKNLLRGDESPGPSTLGPSHLAVTAPRPRRKSASPSSSSDANSAATNWLLETFIVSEDPSTAIHKSRIWDRYTEFCEESGTVPLVDAVLGKRVKECFPSVKTRRSNLQNAYIGITWVETARQQQEQRQHKQQLADRFGEDLANLHISVPTLRRVPKGTRMTVANAFTRTIQEVTTINSEEAWRSLLCFHYHVLQVPRKSDKVVNLTKWVKDLVVRWHTDRNSTTPHQGYRALPHQS